MTSATESSGNLELVHVPGKVRTPLAAVIRRFTFALALVLFVAVVVTIGADGYVDSAGGPIEFLDALYYASVTVTTTGYGDITAVSSGSRLATILLITPARILFLILVVSTTVEVLTDQSRTILKTRRWRKRVNNHFVICGYGATGHSAAFDLVSRGINHDQIVVVDVNPERVQAATADGFVAIAGDASQNAVLAEAAIDLAAAVIVTPNRDDTAVLITLTVRELSSTIHIVASGKEQENLHLLRQSGADQVIDATAAVGHMIGLGTYAPGAVGVLDDILDASSGLELAETEPDVTNGVASLPNNTTLVAIVRGGVRLNPEAVANASLQQGDRLVILREST